ncbi:MAG TPA: hypothetical protein VG326_10140 [Tepidisphaeraceae bacterium]|jgi:hypothetical protein|nr:hypothetical protein [Tepidisphaeraceae bacterium]
MINRQAMISWISAEAGGRAQLPTGPTYSTVARFEEDERWPESAWSLVVDFQKRFKDPRLVLATVRFLNQSAPGILLHAGSRFELFEGRRRVAKGIVLPGAISIPEEINDFEAALIG